MRNSNAATRGVSIGGVLVGCALAAMGAAEPARGASSDRAGRDDIIFQLPPLAPVKRQVAATSAPPSAVREQIEETKPAEASVAAPPLPIFLRETTPPPELGGSEPMAETSAASEPSAPASTLEPAALPLRLASQDSAEDASRPDARRDAPVVPDAAPVSPIVAPVTETALVPEEAPAARREPPARIAEPEDSSVALWPIIAALLALAALGGVVATRVAARRRKAIDAGPDATANEKRPPFAGLSAMQAKFAPLVAAARAKIGLARRGAPTTPAAPEAGEDEWGQVSAQLRASALDPRVASEASSRDFGANSWAAARDDEPDLIEPGDAGARAIVVNARRQLRAARP